MNKLNILLFTGLSLIQPTLSYAQLFNTHEIRDPFTLPKITCSISNSEQPNWALLGTIGTKNMKTAWLKDDKNWFAIQKGDPLPNSFWHVATIQGHFVQLNPVLANTPQCSKETVLEIKFESSTTVQE